ncbi:large ribosomal subunit protein bL21m isoform X2 [Malania oleifera]|uniref:large ribosomal subunit protein bL21m isoform X2 n=1 Tax=Malania oleifera TaxID=397392 RepID=UPI0025ADC74F|nr:large ribosomal subunit protein bL21m isoform X2 [Malania oleifera]
MSNRRCFHSLIRHGSILSSSPSLQPLRTLPHHHGLALCDYIPHKSPNPTNFHHTFCNLEPISPAQYFCSRHFASQGRDGGDDSEDDEGEDDDDDEEEEEEEMGESSDGEAVGGRTAVSNCDVNRTYSAEEKEREAAAIGYKVVGPLDQSEQPFKPHEPAFAVIQVGSHQFKVSDGDSIYTERLKFCEVNDKLILNKVLLLGSRNQTIVGRPILPDAAVHAVVEEHVLQIGIFF